MIYARKSLLSSTNKRMGLELSDFCFETSFSACCPNSVKTSDLSSLLISEIISSIISSELKCSLPDGK